MKESFPYPLARGRLEASPYLWRFAAAEIGAAVAGLLADGRALVAGPQPGVAASAAGGSRPAEAHPGPTARLFHADSFHALVKRTHTALTGRAEADALNPYLTLGELRRELAGGKEWPAVDVCARPPGRCG